MLAGLFFFFSPLSPQQFVRCASQCPALIFSKIKPHKEEGFDGHREDQKRDNVL